MIFMKRFIVAFVLIMCLPCVSFAHQGRTDSSGGHRDYDNDSGLGSYHYHHGYEAHLHTDGICPYDYDSFGSSSESSYNLYTPFYNSDDDINEVYNDGYDYGYESGYADSKKETIPSLAVAFSVPTIVASILTYRSNSKAHKENRTIFQLQQQRRKEEISLEETRKATRYQKLTLQSETEEEKAKLLKEIEEYRDQAKNAKQAADDHMRPFLKTIESQVTYQKEEIEKLKAERKRLEEINGNLQKEIEENSAQPNNILSHLIPKGTIINADGYPVEITPTGLRGDKYLVVINRNSEVYHHPGCYHAWSTNRVNIVVAQKTHRPCSACKHLLPDMHWYRKYIAEKEKQK